ncbi:MAG: ADP-glyceromanno-heptose 6-epimerase [Bdellovibrionales bacterium]|nr:ADP-glyceromanno-heptose 6-epimerase [Bdellovibrionales bacterium]
MYIVTGGAGFIGSAVVAQLNAEGIDDVVVVDELGTSDKWQNLVHQRYSDFIDKHEFIARVLEGSFTDQVTAVFHLGACSSTTETDADYLLHNNFLYSRDLADWALKNGARFVYASSAATYGDGSQGFSDDDSVTPSLRPLNMYAYSKQLMDTWALRTGAAEKIVGLKYFNVFGPNEYHKEDMQSVVLKAFEQIKETGKVKLFKSHRSDFADGEQRRDFVYVKDCAKITTWFLGKPEVNGIYNVGTGASGTWLELVRAVFSAMGKQESIEFVDMPLELQGKYQYFTEANMTKLRSAGYTDEFTSLSTAVKDYVQNYLMQDDRYL